MKKILKSLIMISAVAVLVIGGTVAYFSDEEISTGNVISAGTIDIAVDGENPWTLDAQYSIANLEPSDEQNIDVVLSNVGTNPVIIWKKVFATDADDDTSEPECLAEGGIYASGICTGNTTIDDISSQFVYSMTIGGDTNIDQAWDIRVSDIHDLWVPIGRLDPSDTLAVNQNYYFDENAGNEYQGDSMTLDVIFYAEQLNAPGPANTTRGVVLENKNTTGEWEPIIADGTWGILTWDGSGNFTMKGWGLAGTSYRAVYYNGSSEANIGSGNTPASGGAVTITGTYGNFSSNADAKYWLRDAGYNNPNTLWEANLVN